MIEISELERRATALGITLDAQQLRNFLRYAELLQEWNEKLDLTAVPPEQYLERHFLDSLTLATQPECTKARSLADIGTGAGFPGIPLKIAFPEIKLTLIESLKKRCNFLSTVVEELKLPNVTVLSERGEIAAHAPYLRESFDIVTARAVANLTVLAEILLPYVKVGGLLLALKGEQAKTEVIEAQQTVKACGGGQAEILTVQLPESAQHSTIVRIKKIAASAAHIPRNYAAIVKRPL